MLLIFLKLIIFFFDNYDQVSEIWDYVLKSIVEKIIIFNSFNVTRSKELNLLNKKKLKYIFFSDYISNLNTSNKEIKKKKLIKVQLIFVMWEN